MEEKDLLLNKQFLFERSEKNNRCCLCAIQLVFALYVLDVLSGSLSLLCAIKFVFASSRGWT